MPETEPDFEAILEALADAGVEFIVVGGVCAVLHGAPVSTFDLDLVYLRTRENLSRLEQALTRMGAVYREQPAVSPSASHVDGPGHHLLMTQYGPLDLLGSTVGGQGYRELVEHTEEISLGEDARVRLLDLPTLIRMKEALGRDRDRAMLPILQRTLQERRAGPK